MSINFHKVDSKNIASNLYLLIKALISFNNCEMCQTKLRGDLQKLVSLI